MFLLELNTGNVYDAQYVSKNLTMLSLSLKQLFFQQLLHLIINY